ncbi:MAG: hypothetical protein ACYCXP_04390, partial [Leptospirillum sp.]
LTLCLGCLLHPENFLASSPDLEKFSLFFNPTLVSRGTLTWSCFLAHLTPAVESRTLINLSNNGYYGRTEGYLSYEMNYQADWYQLSLAYQSPYGQDASFEGQRYVFYTTFFYGWLLRKMGYHATPY